MAALRSFPARVSSRIALLLCIALLLARPAGAQRYEFVLIPGNPDGVSDLNEAGVLCGYRFPYGFVWSPQDGQTEFFEFDVHSTQTAGMNNHGHVVGTIRDSEPVNYHHAMRWLGSGTAQDFEPDGAVWSVATDINDLGQIVGATSVPGQVTSLRRAYFAFDTDADGEIESNERVLLPTPAGIEPGYDIPVQIAENGLIIGNANYRATSWRLETATQTWRALLLSDVQDGPGITAWGAGPSGQVVGERSESPVHTRQAFVFIDANGNHAQDPGETVDLPRAGALTSRAYDMNNAGDIVGRAVLHPVYEERAVLWRDDRIVDLNCVAGFSPCINGFDEALAINDAGQILVRSGNAYYILNEVSSNPTLPDQDGDYVCDCADNCTFFNPDQRDRDNDGIGDACDGCRGDLDGNGVVSLSDLANVLHNFGAVGVPYNFGDLDGDQSVGLADLSILLANFGGICT